MVVAIKNDATIEPSYAYFNDCKDLQLPKATITKTIKAYEDGFTITIQSDVLAKNIQLETAIEGFFSDNYFDILAGESRTIEFKTKNKTFENNDLKIRSLVDSYN